MSRGIVGDGMDCAGIADRIGYSACGDGRSGKQTTTFQQTVQLMRRSGASVIKVDIAEDDSNLPRDEGVMCAAKHHRVS